jgi:hypothetical protein
LNVSEPQPAAALRRQIGMRTPQPGTRVPGILGAWPLLAAAGCALLGLAGCGTQHAVPPAGVTGSTGGAPAPPPPHQRAVADAARIIASFPVPPGAARSARAPSPLLGAPPEGPATPDVVTATRWWTAPGRPQAVLAWVAAHLPAGFALGGQGSGGYGPRVRVRPGVTRPPQTVQHPDEWFDQFDLPVVPNVLTQRWLLVDVAAAGGGRTAIRVDAQVVWLPARPAAERMPRQARVVTVAPVFGVGSVSARDRRADPAVTITDPAKVAAIAAVVDGLPVFPPGTMSCPADFGSKIRLTFRASRNGPVLAQVTGDDSGCEGVSVVVGGTSQPALGDGGSLQRDVLSIAGIRWSYRLGFPGG